MAGWLTRVRYGLIGLASFAACSNAESSSPEPLGSAEAHFSPASCAAASPNALFQDRIDPALVSPQTYDNCYKSYVADIVALSADYALPHSVLKVDWADVLPPTQSRCENTSIAGLFYEWILDATGTGGTGGTGTGGTGGTGTGGTGGTSPGGRAGILGARALTGTGGRIGTGPGHWEVISEIHQSGTWAQNHCSYMVEQGGLVAGKSYRIAATARNGADDTRKVSIATIQ